MGLTFLGEISGISNAGDGSDVSFTKNDSGLDSGPEMETLSSGSGLPFTRLSSESSSETYSGSVTRMLSSDSACGLYLNRVSSSELSSSENSSGSS